MPKINKQFCQQFRTDFMAAVAGLEKTHGVKIDLGNIRFDDTSLRSQLSVTDTDAVPDAANSTGKVATWRSDFLVFATLFGLKPDDLGKVVTFKGQHMTVAGLRPRAKLPLVLRSIDNKFIAVDANKEIANQLAS